MSKIIKLIWFSSLLVGYIEAGSGISCFGTFRSTRNETKDIIEIYNEIDQHLRQVHLIEPEDMMTETINWLTAQISSTPSKDSSIQKSLEQILALRNLKDDTNCDVESYKVLLANDEAAENRSHTYKHNRRPIHKMLGYYYKNHALSCRLIHYNKLIDKLKQTDRKRIAPVEMMTSGYIDAKFSGMIVRGEGPAYEVLWKYMNGLKEYLEHKDLVDVDKATKMDDTDLCGIKYPVSMLTDLAKGDPDERVLSKTYSLKEKLLKSWKSGIKHLYMKYMIEPCEYFINELSDEILMAVFDHDMIDDYKFKDREMMVDIYMNRAALQLCQELTGAKREGMLNILLYEFEHIYLRS